MIVNLQGVIYDAVHMRNERICVVGMGYVGLTLALKLSELGFLVTGTDRRQRAIEPLSQGKSHFFEHGLDELLQRELGKQFRFQLELDPQADIYIVAVGTPVKDKVPNLEDLRSASESLGKVLHKGNMVILRSTVPVRTTRDLVLPILERVSGLKGGTDFHLAFAPERTIEGNALQELTTLPQVVGGLTDECVERTVSLFAKMTPSIVPVRNLEAAEMVKVVNNIYRDVTFAFANEVAQLCDRYNIDSHDVIKAANVGYERSRVPLPSPGVGGYCLTKDPHIFAYAARQVGFEPQLVPMARSVNEQMPGHVTDKVNAFMRMTGRNVAGAKALLLGVAFKGHPETSDIRFSPTIDVAKLLSSHGYDVHAYDRRVPAEEILKESMKPVANLEDGFRDADVIIVMNNHPMFAELDVAALLPLAKSPRLYFDTWRMLSHEKVLRVPDTFYANLGFDTFRG